MTKKLYSGPIIDAHHHLWDLRMKKHPWLAPDGGFGPPGAFDPLKGPSTSTATTRRTLSGRTSSRPFTSKRWDGADDPINETRWLESLNKT